MKHINFSFLIPVFIGFTFLSVSCKKSAPFGSNNWSPEVAMPLVNAEFALKDITKRSAANIIEDANGFVTFVYETKLFSKSANEAIDLGEQRFRFATGVDAGIVNIFNNLPPNIDTVPIPLATPPPINFVVNAGTTLDSVILKQGNISLECGNRFNQDLTVIFRIPSATKNGQAFQQRISIPANSNVSPSFNLDGYRLNLSTGTPPQPSLLSIEVGGVIRKISPTLSGDSLTVKMTLNQMKFSRAFGIIGSQNLLPQPDTADITIFTNALTGGISIKNPSIRFDVQNSFGLGMQLSFLQLKTLSNANPGIPTPVTGSFQASSSNPFTVAMPTYNVSPGVTNQSFTVSATNSNISSVIYQAPYKLIYQVSTTLNPGPPVQNFIYDTSTIRTSAYVELPFEGYVNNLAFRDTFPFDFNRPELIERLIFRSNITNDFPMDAKLQLYFVTETFEKRDSLFLSAADQVVIPKAPVNADGISTGSSNKIYDIIYNATDAGKLTGVKKIIMIASLSTTDYDKQKNVKFLSRYRMKVRFGIRAKVKMSL
jgi:hypothetical protein